ncbi:MAG: APC family permease [Desulfurococcaceae archaeon]
MSKVYRPALKKALTSIDVFVTGFGALIGWGWIVLWGEFIYRAGVLMTVVGYLIVLALMLFIGFVYGELASMMPVAGGELAFAFRAFGPRLCYITGWFMAVAYIALVMFEAASVPHIFAYLFPEVFKTSPLYSVAGYNVYLPMVLFGAALGVLWTFVNYIGARPYGIVMTAMTLLFAAVGFSTFLAGISQGIATPQYVHNFVTNLTGELPPALGLSLVLGLAGFFYIGFDMIPQAAEEYKYESRKLARLITFSITIGTLWYLLVTLLDGFLLPREIIPKLDMPTADAVATAWGPLGRYVVVFVGIFGILTTYVASFYAAVRVIFSLARAKLLLEWFSRVHPRYGVPSYATLFVGALAVIATLFGRRSLVWFVDATSAYVALLYLMTCLAFIKLRRSEPQAERPYRAPLGVIAGVIGAIASIMIFVSVITPGFPAALVWPEEYVIFLVFLVMGIVFYLLTPYARRKISAEEIAHLVLGEYMSKKHSSRSSM